jgi:hypothetical protein
MIATKAHKKVTSAGLQMCAGAGRFTISIPCAPLACPVFCHNLEWVVPYALQHNCEQPPQKKGQKTNGNNTGSAESPCMYGAHDHMIYRYEIASSNRHNLFLLTF